MTAQLKLIWRYTADYSGSSLDSLDLLRYAEGFNLTRAGWLPQAAADKDNVIEAIPLRVSGSSNDDLARKIQDLDLFKQRTKLAREQNDTHGVYLRAQLENETQWREACVYNLDYALNSTPYDVFAMRGSYISDMTLSVEREPYWEESSYTTASIGGLNSIGGSAVMSASVPGDVPARMFKMRMGPGACTLSVIWAGLKTSRFGTASNFKSVWGLNYNDYDPDTTDTSDATAYTGQRVVTTFTADNTMKWRTRTSALDVTVNANDQRGMYLVLLRAKMSDSSQAYARLLFSFDSSYPSYRSKVIISGTSWNLYEMGNITNPPSRADQYQDLGGFTLELQAQRISGSGSLHSDCLILIPIDDGAIKFDSGVFQLTAGSQRFIAYQAEDESVSGFVEGSVNAISYTALAAPQNVWQMPNDTSRPVIVVAGMDVVDGSVLSRTIDVSYFYRTRWRTLRGNTA